MKGEVTWDYIAKIVLMLLMLIVLIMAIISLSGKSNSLFDGFKSLFGGLR